MEKMTREKEYYSTAELLSAGFGNVGTCVCVSRKTSLYAINGSIGNHVRIDDFCTLKGRISIGSHVHIAGYCSISGATASVTIGDFVSVANRVSIYAGSDDYRAAKLNGPMVPPEFVKTISAPVILQEASLIGAHSVILPGVTVGRGASVGALCLIYRSIEPGAIIVSSCAEGVCKGERNLKEIEKAIAAVRSLQQYPLENPEQR